jgi:hypothetical protein
MDDIFSFELFDSLQYTHKPIAYMFVNLLLILKKYQNIPVIKFSSWGIGILL